MFHRKKTRRQSSFSSRAARRKEYWGLAATVILTTASQNAAATNDGWGRMLLSESALQRTGRQRPRDPQPGAANQMPARGKSYVIPAAEIAAFQFLLNRFDNRFVGPDYDVSLASVRRNLRSSWVEDRDPFVINQLGHPYQGSIYFGIARSSGLGFWESLGYTFAGSAAWEIAGETTLPSRNDQITTSFAGTFLGESLFRMANLVRERGTSLSPGWREAAAAVISPPTGFNRLVFPDRLAAAFSSNHPATSGRLQVGASTTLTSVPGTSAGLRRNEAIVDYSLDYGLPGKDGYQYEKPFDYFNFQVRGSSVRGVESVHNRGLLLGRSYEAGPAYRGIWGFYGSYDYLAPQLFRVSSTALSLGTTAEWHLSDTLALQGTATAGAGFTSVGTIRGASERDYNFGVAPQTLLALRMIFGDTASLDMNIRHYFAGWLAQSRTGGSDRVFRADAGLTVRLQGNHAVAIKYVSSRRNSSFPDLGERFQRRDTIGIYYTFLQDGNFGTLNW